MKTEIKYDSQEAATAGINADIASQPPTTYDSFFGKTPLNIHYWQDGEMDIDQWTGNRRFSNDHDGCWTPSKYVCFNKDGTKLHLSEYWPDNCVGIYVRKDKP